MQRPPCLGTPTRQTTPPPGRHTPRQTSPRAHTPRQTSPWADNPPPNTATAADGTHPTGMHPCFKSGSNCGSLLHIYLVSGKQDSPPGGVTGECSHTRVPGCPRDGNSDSLQPQPGHRSKPAKDKNVVLKKSFSLQ